MAQPENIVTADLKVQRFVRSFEPGYLALACHAALPLILTPELLNYLRNRFLPGQVPWVAEADLLLSDLCSEIGHETYAMDPDMRAHLLSRLAQDYGRRRMRDVALLLINYVRHLARTSPGSRPHELQSQQWAALVYLDDRREEAVRELAESLRECAAALEGGDARAAAAHRGEMLRLSNLVHELAHQLGDYPELVGYAKLTRELLSSQTESVPEHLQRERQFSQSTELPGGTVLPPVGALVSRAPAAAREMRRLALLIYFNEYDIGLPRLPPESEDLTQSLGEALTALGFGVRTLFRATHSELMKELRLLGQEMTPDDLLLFYFSGYASPGFDEPRLLLRATHNESPNEESVSESPGFGEISLTTVLNALRIAENKVVMLLDPQIYKESERWMDALNTVVKPQLSSGQSALITPQVMAPSHSSVVPLSLLEYGFFTKCLINILAERARGVSYTALTPLRLFERITRMYDETTGGDAPVARPQVLGLGAAELIIDGPRYDAPHMPGELNPFERHTQELSKPFGRETLLPEILGVIRRGLYVWLVGGRGLGKTELLQALCAVGSRETDSTSVVFVYMDMQSLGSDDEFVEILGREMGVELPAVTSAGEDWPLGLAKRLLGRRIVLCVDNIDTAYANRYARTIRALHLLGEESKDFILVVASRDAPETFGEGVMPRQYYVLLLKELSDDEARKSIIDRLAGSGVEFTEAELKFLVKQGQGNPSKLRKAAANLFEVRRSADLALGDEAVSAVATTTRLPPWGYISYDAWHLSPEALNGLLPDLVSGVHYELSRLTGSPVEIFLKPGYGGSVELKRFLEEQLRRATFFLPIISSNYFEQEFCRSELTRFLTRERELQRNDLIFPIYLDDSLTLTRSSDDPLAMEILRRQGITLSSEAGLDDIGLTATVRRLANVIASALQRNESAVAPQPTPPADERPPESFAAKIRALRAVPAFSILSEDAAIGVAGGMSYKTFAPGEIVLYKGADDATLYIIVEGEVRNAIGRSIKSNSPKFINLLGLLTGVRSGARWVAWVQGAACYKLDKSALASVLKKSPQLPEAMAGAYLDTTEASSSRVSAMRRDKLAAQIRAFYQLPSTFSKVVRNSPPPFSASGETHVVDSQGGASFRTVGSAVAKARAGDRVLVRPGFYREALHISKPLEIVGDRSVSSEVVIEAKGKSCVSFDATGGRLENLTLRASAKDNMFGVRVSKGSLDVTDCRIEGFAEDGIKVGRSAAASINASVISTCSTGVSFEGEGRLRHCEIKNNLSMGVHVGSRGRVLIEGNDISNNSGFGINIKGGDATISSNRLFGNLRRAIEPVNIDERRVQLLDNVITEFEPSVLPQTSIATRSSDPAGGRKGSKKKVVNPGGGSRGVNRAGGKVASKRGNSSKGGSKPATKSAGKKAKKSLLKKR